MAIRVAFRRLLAPAGVLYLALVLYEAGRYLLWLPSSARAGALGLAALLALATSITFGRQLGAEAQPRREALWAGARLGALMAVLALVSPLRLLTDWRLMDLERLRMILQRADLEFLAVLLPALVLLTYVGWRGTGRHSAASRARAAV